MSSLSQAVRAASEAGDTGQVSDLLHRVTPEELDQTDSNGWTALMLASSGGHTGVASLLVNAKVGVEAECSKNGNTALVIASQKGHADIVKLLIDAGASVHARNKFGSSALMWAASSGHADIVKMLLAAGADVHVRNKDGKTALTMAATEEIGDLLHAASVPLLVECERLLRQVAVAPHCRGQMERLLTVRAQIAAALAEDDFELVASLGAAADSLKPESLHEPLSERDYATLPARHAELVHRVAKKCRELAEEKNFAALNSLSAELDSLKARETTGIISEIVKLTGAYDLAPPAAPLAKSDVAALVQSGKELRARCDALLQAAEVARQLREMAARMAEMSAHVDAANAAGDFQTAASLGHDLRALEREASLLPLPEEGKTDDQSLRARQAELMLRVTERCRDLAEIQQSAALGKLAAKLRAIQALDL